MEDATATTVSNLVYLVQAHKEWAGVMKAAAIAESVWNTYKGATAAYTSALAGFPPPFNFVLAPAMASIAVAAGIANVQQIANQKYHTGGEVQATLQIGEYVMNRQVVSRYGVPAMEAINQGRAPAGGAGGGGMNATIINTIDPGLMDRYLASSNGQKAIVNIMRAKRYEVNRVLK